MELYFNEATARLSIFEESLEYLINLNGKEFYFSLLALFSYQWLNKRHLMKISLVNVIISNTISITQPKSYIHSTA